jgi:hypothetical protein
MTLPSPKALLKPTAGEYRWRTPHRFKSAARDNVQQLVTTY